MIEQGKDEWKVAWHFPKQDIVRVSEWLLFNSAIFQPNHGQNKLIFNEMMMRSVLDQHTLDVRW